MANLNDMATALIHHPYQPPGGFETVQPGVHKASTVIFENTAALKTRQWKDKSGYTYGLHGTPTTFTLEERLATLEGGLQALLAPSGLAAIALVDMALLRSGDEVLIPDNAYGPGKDFARGELAHWGITHRVYDPQDPASLAAQITERTKLVWLEAAGSVTLEFPDLVGLLAVTRAHPNIVTVLDNTWGAGLAFDAFRLGQTPEGEAFGVDVTIHALTKYPSGGGDVLMGAVVTRDATLHHRLKMTHMRLGLGVGANDAELVLRGLPSLAVRYAAHDASTRQIAHWLTEQPEISQVLHPSLPHSPGHSHWLQTCRAAGGLVSMVFDAQRFTQDRVEAFVDALKLFKIGYSWGGPLSLVMPYELQGMRQLGSLAGQQGTLVRLAVGLEKVDDLIADLAQALRVLRD
ncbi:MAG: PLP-dependent transferase [Aquabacterium sp.]|jgi:cystathionine beta-lyase|uniref:PLP-dependent transferase n=1 Tax=Aquabacterium sp. TaxID=1872578 RepID=UPI002A36DE01|nr:PLP-dependent transferase [Aquabacterium sp.]MDX9842332.1 PLP-dependent transferase [Aquabacterium sp.]